MKEPKDLSDFVNYYLKDYTKSQKRAIFSFLSQLSMTKETSNASVFSVQMQLLFYMKKHDKESYDKLYDFLK